MKRDRPVGESYLSTSTYAYVSNNPVLMTAPDGRWMDDSGHITDTTGQTFGFLGASYKPQGATNYLGVKYGDGGGGSLTVGDLLSTISPNFQFDKNSEKFYKENYPEFYDFVMNILPKIINDKNFMSILSDTSGFSMEELTKIFKSDTDFALMGFKEATLFSIADHPYGSNPKAPINLIRMDINTLEWFKTANRDTKTLEGITNIVQMAGFIGHEINHWGVSAETNSSFRAKNLGGDPGDYFERKLMNGRQKIGDPGLPSGAFNSYIKQNYNTLFKIFNK